MNKQAFLATLRIRLSALPEEDIRRSLDYYSEMIDDRIEEGLSEEQAVQAVGSIDEIVAQILGDATIPPTAKTKKRSARTLKTWEIVLLVLGAPVWIPLLAAALILLLSLFIIIWSGIVVLYAVAISFAAVAAAGVCGAFPFFFFGNPAVGGVFLGMGLFCCGIAVLLFLAFAPATKGIAFLCKHTALGIHDLLFRKGDAQ